MEQGEAPVEQEAVEKPQPPTPMSRPSSGAAAPSDQRREMIQRWKAFYERGLPAGVRAAGVKQMKPSDQELRQAGTSRRMQSASPGRGRRSRAWTFSAALRPGSPNSNRRASNSRRGHLRESTWTRRRGPRDPLPMFPWRSCRRGFGMPGRTRRSKTIPVDCRKYVPSFGSTRRSCGGGHLLLLRLVLLHPLLSHLRLALRLLRLVRLLPRTRRLVDCRRHVLLFGNTWSRVLLCLLPPWDLLKCPLSLRRVTRRSF